MNPARALVYIGAVGVKAAPVAANNSIVTLPKDAQAGTQSPAFFSVFRVLVC